MADTALARSPLHPASWDTRTSDDDSGTRHLPLMSSVRVPQVPAWTKKGIPVVPFDVDLYHELYLTKPAVVQVQVHAPLVGRRLFAVRCHA